MLEKRSNIGNPLRLKVRPQALAKAIAILKEINPGYAAVQVSEENIEFYNQTKGEVTGLPTIYQVMLKNISSCHWSRMWSQKSFFKDWEPDTNEKDATGPDTIGDKEVDALEITEDMLSSGVPIPSSFVGQTLPSETVKELMKVAFANVDTEGKPATASQVQDISLHDSEREEMTQEIPAEVESQGDQPPVLPIPRLKGKPTKEFSEGYYD